MTELHWIAISAIIGAVLYSVASWLRSEKRNDEGRCARCGVKLAPDMVFQVPFDIDRGRKGTTVAMCEKCAEHTVHNHWGVYWFFIVAACVCLAVTIGMIVSRSIDLVHAHRFDMSTFVLPLYLASTATGMIYYARSVKRSLLECDILDYAAATQTETAQVTADKG